MHDSMYFLCCGWLSSFCLLCRDSRGELVQLIDMAQALPLNHYSCLAMTIHMLAIAFKTCIHVSY